VNQSTSFKQWLRRASQQAWTSYDSISVVSVYATYEEVYEDDSFDIVYNATPHTFHKRDCLDAIRYKKRVLCGLPLATNAEEAEEVLVVAKVRGVFIMEGGICICSRLSLCQHC
jgi:predicted dehydrogenase